MSIPTDGASRQAVVSLADRLSAALFVPYLAWVSFASLLNASIRWLNR